MDVDTIIYNSMQITNKRMYQVISITFILMPFQA